MEQERFAEQAQETLALSQDIVHQFHHSQWDVEHILLALLRQKVGLVCEVLTDLGVNLEVARQQVELVLEQSQRVTYETGQIYATPRVVQLISKADEEATRLKDEFIGIEHLFIAMTSPERLSIAMTTEEKGKAAGILYKLGVNKERVYVAFHKIRASHRVTDAKAKSKYPFLEKYGYDLTEMSRKGNLAPVVGRDGDLNQLVNVLTRKIKKSPLLVGDITIDKFSIVEGLAQRIEFGNVPSVLKQKKIIALDLGKLVAGAKFRGQFEERIEAVLTEVDESQGTVIPYFDELWVGVAEGGLDIGSILKFPLSVGRLQCIGATVPKYLEFFVEKGMLARQFEVINIGKSENSTDSGTQ